MCLLLMWYGWWEWALCRSTSVVPIINTTQKGDKRSQISRISGISLDRAFQSFFLASTSSGSVWAIGLLCRANGRPWQREKPSRGGT